MATCKNCGAEIEDGVKTCPSCMAQVEEPAEEKTSEEKTAEEKTSEEKASEEKTAAGSFEEKVKKIFDTKDTTADYDAKDAEDNKAMGVLAYLSWLVLIPLIAAKDSPFARFHCNQGLLLAIVETVVAVVFGLLSMIPYVGWLFGVCESLCELCCFVLFIFGIMNAVNGKAKELPLIGKYKILK